LGRHRSTIKREINRNSLGLYDGTLNYDAVPAQSIAQERRKEGCEGRFKVKDNILDFFEEKIAIGWSPDVIAGRLNMESGKKVIHRSSIYRFIENDRMQFPSKRYFEQLPRFGKRRRGSARRSPGTSRGKRRSIRERTKGCETRRQIGHFERDLMEGLRGKSAVLVFADRKSRKISLSLVHRNSASVQKSSLSFVKRQREKVRSITNDNGFEFKPTSITRAEKKLRTKFYYCDPGCPWQRGTVENVIGILRHYFPKRTDFTNLSKYKLKKVENLLNNRPRKILKYKTPSEIYFSQSRKGR
jgi:IS30 family transposase